MAVQWDLHEMYLAFLQVLFFIQYLRLNLFIEQFNFFFRNIFVLNFNNNSYQMFSNKQLISNNSKLIVFFHPTSRLHCTI